jgi:O-succinylbenzoic acid--CoA ligase
MDDWVSRAAAERPAHPAVLAREGALSYAALDEGANRTARRLAALGVGPRDRVATTLPAGLDFCELLHALPRLGAALVPLSARLRPDERRRRATAAGAALTVDGPIEDGFETDVAPPGELDPEAVHTVLHTSGTTGEPKPVELSLANHDASAAASAAVLGSTPADRWLCALPPFHVAGLAILLRAARAGATVVLFDRFDASRVAAGLRAGEATHVSLVPTMLRRLRAAGLEQAPELRGLLLGGGPIPHDLLAWARAAGLPARCTYGMTETASQVVLTEPGETAGLPLPGVDIEVAPDGEILVRGAMVARAALAGDGWLHTGDSGHLDRAGRLHVTGRLKELIVTGGEKVAPAAVEAALLEHPALADAGVAGVPDADWGEAVTAFVVERRPVSDYELDAFCRERLPAHEVPKRIVRVERLPRNEGGKLLRERLAASA